MWTSDRRQPLNPRIRIFGIAPLAVAVVYAAAMGVFGTVGLVSIVRERK